MLLTRYANTTVFCKKLEPMDVSYCQQVLVLPPTIFAPPLSVMINNSLSQVRSKQAMKYKQKTSSLIISALRAIRLVVHHLPYSIFNDFHQ